MEHAALIADYLKGPELLREAVKGMTREQLLARPVAGKWSTQEVVCHLADFDPIIADRMKRVIAEEKPSLIGANENAFAAKLCYEERDVNEELTIIENTRRQMGRILKKLSPEDFQRTGMHSERGELTLKRLLELAVKHIPHHVEFVKEKRKALGV
jgi:uncharacterized damage-inducible protein DinB